MAHAEKATREVVTTTSVPVIRLDLTQAEAETLAVVLSRVGGSPSSPRGDAENILDALTDVIGMWDSFKADSLVDYRNGDVGIFFRSEGSI